MGIHKLAKLVFIIPSIIQDKLYTYWYLHVKKTTKFISTMNLKILTTI